MKHFVFIAFLSLFAGIHCGDVEVTVGPETYNAKIVVDGFLIPGLAPADIRIMRNFPLNQPLDYNELFIADAWVAITELATGREYPLVFNPLPALEGKFPGYYYAGTDFIIDYDKRYQLSVQATIDGKALETTSTCTIPPAGFEVLNTKSIIDTLNYSEKDRNGALKKFTLHFLQSPGIGSYVSSVHALDADPQDSTTFIENNVLGVDWENLKRDRDEGEEIDPVRFVQFQHTWQWDITPTGQAGERSEIELEWFNFWFYGNYRVILYAADDQFTDYLLTHRQIQEIDGNLLEPRFYFEGDGVGVFAAAIPDTVRFYVQRHVE